MSARPGRTNYLVGLEHALSEVERALEPPQPVDSAHTVRVIGEFSSGKSRLLAELFRGLVPDRLLPVSNLERETKLPLEIVHGEHVALQLIERADDTCIDDEVIVYEEFDTFPSRDEIMRDGRVIDPGKHRLRLTITEPRLVSERALFDDEKPLKKKVYLIDTPGWNSGEEDPTKDRIESARQPAVVWVCPQHRLAHQESFDELRELIERIVDSYCENVALIPCVTFWGENDSPAHRALEDCLKHLDEIIEEELAGDHVFRTDPVCVDLGNLDDASRVEFRAAFWDRLLPALSPTDDVERSDGAAQRMDTWGDITEVLGLTLDRLAVIERILERFYDDSGCATPNWNRTRLEAYGPKEQQDHLESAWFSRLGLEPRELDRALDTNFPTLEEDHPLHQWWCHVVQLRCEEATTDTMHAVLRMRMCFSALMSDQQKELNAWLRQQTRPLYDKARASVSGVRKFLSEDLRTLLDNKDVSHSDLIAMLLALSALEGFFAYAKDDSRTG